MVLKSETHIQILAFVLVVGYMLLELALIGGITWAAFHFIAKWW